MELLLGHLVGDYLLQNKYLAFNKGSPGFKGVLVCFLHCAIYTTAVCAFTVFTPLSFVLIFLTHYPIDRWSLGQRWLDLIGGRNWQDDAKAGDAIGLLFSPSVYILVDNTLHLVLMWAVLRLL